MGWEVVKTYTKECGCECQDKIHDVDRPFMCYTDYETIITKMCDVHKRKEEEYRKEREEYERQERQRKEEEQQKLSLYLESLQKVEHRCYVRIKEAVSKYKEHFKIHMSDRWIQDKLHTLKYPLMIEKIGNKWVCSKERLDSCDFDYVCKHDWNVIRNCANPQSKNIVNDTSMDLVGEDRQYGGSLLYKDLIPSSSWGNNVRTRVTRSSWDNLRKTSV